MVRIQTGMNKGWDAGESFYLHLRFASHTLKSCLVTHMKSEWIRRIIKCSMASNSASKLIKIGYTCSYPMPASIRVWLTLILPEPTPGCCPTEHTTKHLKIPPPTRLTWTKKTQTLYSNSNSDQFFKIHDQSQVKFLTGMAHSEICHFEQRVEISQGHHLFTHQPNWILLIFGDQMRFCSWCYISK